MERPRLRRGLNYHHIWWTQRSYNYQNPIEEKFREHGAFVLPMIVPVHKELHDWIEPPPKPSPYQMYAILGDLALFKPRERTEGIYRAINTLNMLARIDGEPSENALQIAEHLSNQINYLNEGNPYAQASAMEG